MKNPAKKIINIIYCVVIRKLIGQGFDEYEDV